jgi:hypothetical protein
MVSIPRRWRSGYRTVATQSGRCDWIGFAIPTHIAGWDSQPVATTEEYEKLSEKSAKADGLVLNSRSGDGKRSFVVLKAE